MGIQSLNPFLQTKCKRAFRTVAVSDFSGKRIVIDTPLWSYARFSSAYMQKIVSELSDEDLLKKDPFSDDTKESIRLGVFERAASFVAELFKNGITPIFIFDGTAVPEKNSGARERRKSKRVELEKKAADLREQINDTDPLIRKKEDFIALRSILKQQPPVNPSKELPLLKKFIENNLGCKCIDAPDEAEKFCAYLAKIGVAAASFTTDTDSYAFGAPVIISSFDNSVPNSFKSPTHFKCVVSPLIFEGLNLTYNQFVDLCILFGCDFNDRIPKIGPEKAWKMIREAQEKDKDAKRLIEIASTIYPDLDWELLNCERCREIFLDNSQCETVFNRIKNEGFEINKKNVTNSTALMGLRSGIDYSKASDTKYYD